MFETQAWAYLPNSSPSSQPLPTSQGSEPVLLGWALITAVRPDNILSPSIFSGVEGRKEEVSWENIIFFSFPPSYPPSPHQVVRWDQKKGEDMAPGSEAYGLLMPTPLHYR